MSSVVADAKLIVVKVGSSLLTNDGKGLDATRMVDWTRQIGVLVRAGRQVVLVSSGAIACGMQRLGWKKRPHAVHELQAAAAVGQMGLIEAYDSLFRAEDLIAAQILLTHDDLADRKRYLNALSTMKALLDLGVVPIINENDTVVTEEIKFGDNDTLGALVANLIEADVLVILTDQHGLYTADPRKDPQAQLLTEVQAGDPALERMAGGAGTEIGRGGMLTKVLAAKRAARSGAHTVVAGGREPDVLLRLADGEMIGTQFTTAAVPLAARKKWLADHLQVRGRLLLDAGAARALRDEGKSLLPVGVKEVIGNFERGEAVTCVGPDGREVARGLVNYDAADARRIVGRPTSAIEDILGYLDEVELIHRDNLVLL